MTKIDINGVEHDMSPEQQAKYDAAVQAFKDNLPNQKLGFIRKIRNKKLQETDHFALSDVTLTDEMKSYRQGMRDIPQNNTTEEQYDLILARVNGKLTHAIWSKP